MFYQVRATASIMISVAIFMTGCDSDNGVPLDTFTGDVPGDTTAGDTPVTDTVVDTTTDIPTDGEGMTLAEWCELYENRHQDWFTWYDSCCSADDIASDDFYTKAPYLPEDVDVAGCISRYEGRIAEGSIVFNGARGQACLDALAAIGETPPAGCTGIPWGEIVLMGHGLHGFDQIPACRETFVGQILRDQPCSYGTDCVDPLRCRDMGSDWLCSDASGLGGLCSLNGECEDDLFCIEDSCRPVSGAYGTCTWSYHCEDGLMCDYSDNMCYTPGDIGDSCGSSLPDCEPGLMCDLMSTDRCIIFPAAGGYCMFSGLCQGRCDTTISECVSMCGSP